jgi:hypothetical protein
MLHKLGLTGLKDSPGSYFFHKNRKPLVTYAFTGAAGDFGFEAFQSQI